MFHNQQLFGFLFKFLLKLKQDVEVVANLLVVVQSLLMVVTKQQPMPQLFTNLFSSNQLEI